MKKKNTLINIIKVAVGLLVLLVIGYFVYTAKMV